MAAALYCLSRLALRQHQQPSVRMQKFYWEMGNMKSRFLACSVVSYIITGGQWGKRLRSAISMSNVCISLYLVYSDTQY